MKKTLGGKKMLQNQWWYCYHKALETELLQCRDEGKDVAELEKEAEAE